MILTPQDLAKRWSMSVQTLSNMRAKGSGPAFFKVGSSVRYRLEDVEVYESKKQLRS